MEEKERENKEWEEKKDDEYREMKGKQEVWEKMWEKNKAGQWEI